ncbi:MAG: OmpA family protein [Bacteroidia bacterium]|nr:OmpA family protein [Bacteroidia bacterium]
MKNALTLLGLWLILRSGSLDAQNLVPNASFEEYTQCPRFLGAVRSYNINIPEGIVREWMANPPDCTPDYFNACAKGKFGTPRNLCGEAKARDGRAYLGMILRIGEVHIGSIQDLLYREHVTARLLETLKPEAYYEVRFYVRLAEYSNFAIGNIGVLFSEDPIIIQENKSYQPQILHTGIIRDLENWVEIRDTFQAKGGERYISLGNFDNYESKKIIRISNSTQYRKKFNYNRAYYYLDQVSVEEIQVQPIPDKQPPDEDPPVIVSDWGHLRAGKRIILKNVLFEFDRANLLPSSLPELDELGRFLRQYPSLKVSIIGHTDSIGTEADNRLLSLARAQTVTNYLVSQGIESARLSAEGLGESQPLDTNATEDGRQNNRRVELLIKDLE